MNSGAKRVGTGATCGLPLSFDFLGNRPALLRERYRILWPFEEHRGKEAGTTPGSRVINIARRNCAGGGFAIGQLRAHAKYTARDIRYKVGEKTTAPSSPCAAHD